QPDVAEIALRRSKLRTLRFGRGVANDGGAHRQLDAADLGFLRLPAREHAFGIMRLNPALEKTRGNRQTDGAVTDALKIHAGEPTRIDVVAHGRAKAPLHACPAILFRARHLIRSSGLAV